MDIHRQDPEDRLQPWELKSSGLLSAHVYARLSEGVVELERANASGVLHTLLHSRTIGILAGYGLSPRREAALLEAAWRPLGVRISLISAELLDVEGDVHMRRVAYTLEKLYDAVACQGVVASWAERLRDNSGLLMVEDLVSAHFIEAFAERLPSTRPPEANLRLALQAVLISLLR